MGVKLANLGPNKTEIATGHLTTFYSYDTPVVVTTSGVSRTCAIPSVFVSDQKVGPETSKYLNSRTTRKHISMYLAALPSNWKRFYVSQSQIEKLVG